MTLKISVIIPVYNAEKYLERAVMSALDQPETGEVILVEDNSPDNALELCRELEKKHDKVKLFRHSDGKNHGAGASRNLGIAKAQFDYIAFLDADDYYLPDRFKKTSEVFEQNPDADGVYEIIEMEFSNDIKKEEWFNDRGHRKSAFKRWEPEELLTARAIYGDGYFHLNGLTLNKRVFNKVTPFDKELKLAQDTEFNTRLVAKCKVYSGELEKPVAMRLWHDLNREGKNDEKKSAFEYKILCAEKLVFWARKNCEKKELRMIQMFLFNYIFMSLFPEKEEKSRINRISYDVKCMYYSCGRFKMIFKEICIIKFVGIFSKKIERFIVRKEF